MEPWGITYPDFLQEPALLSQHFGAEYQGLSTTAKGDRFERFVTRLISDSEIGLGFYSPKRVTEKTAANDEGVDLIAQGRDGKSILYIQARMAVDRANKIDTILNEFQSYIKKNKRIKQLTYLPDAAKTGQEDEAKTIYLMAVTLSNLKGILKSYPTRESNTKDFYIQATQDQTLKFVDINEIWSTLRKDYRKLVGGIIPEMTLNLDGQYIHRENVYIGVVSSDELRRLHGIYGDSIFFENIRSFIEPVSREGRKEPNEAIIETVQKYPDRMLEKNNGIVLKAERVTLGKEGSQLILTKGSVVNGCQTTTCVVKYAETTCYVPVKIVQTDNAWEIAEAANFQNEVNDIDLKIAQNMRTQLAVLMASKIGVSIDTASQITDEIHNRRVSYDETRLIYIGLFSQTPVNIFGGNYTVLSYGLMRRFAQREEIVFEFLFKLQQLIKRGLDEASTTLTHDSYIQKIKRLYDENPAYRCFIGILALCGVMDVDISAREDEEQEYDRMEKFIMDSLRLFNSDEDKYIEYFILACAAWADEVMPSDVDESVQSRDMTNRTRRIKFPSLLGRLHRDVNVQNKMMERKRATKAARVD